MGTDKQSTKTKEINTVETKHEYFLPEYGITVEATSIKEAEEIAKKRNKQEQE